MATLEIYPDQIQATNWKVGHILEDVRHGSATQGCQFEITDNENGSVQLRQLEDEEYVVPGEVFSRIKQ